MHTLQQIIDEVDAIVPNSFAITQKTTWLNELNREFFEVVKIPVTLQKVFGPGESEFLPSDIRSRNIVHIRIGNTIYLSIQYETVNPGHNFWIFDDVTRKLTLEPLPILAELGHITYYKTNTKTLVLSDSPEAPEEYHWAYVLGLAEKVSKAMNDVTLANNYGNDYRAQLSQAQQNYGNRQVEG